MSEESESVTIALIKMGFVNLGNNLWMHTQESISVQIKELTFEKLFSAIHLMGQDYAALKIRKALGL